MVFYVAFNTILVISQRHLTLLMSFLGFTSARLGLLPKDTPTKNLDDPVWLKPMTPGLRINSLPNNPNL